MSLTHRQTRILDIIEREGHCGVLALAQEFEVSDETIRRDLRVLSESGMVEKFHGGVRKPAECRELSFDRRLRINAEAKAMIAERALTEIPEGATLLLDNSSTACFLARALHRHAPTTVLTISLEVAYILSQAGDRHQVIMPGGEIRMHDRCFIGVEAIRYIKDFTPDYFITSMVAGTAAGCRDFDLAEARFKQAMLPLARNRVVLMDSSKFTLDGLIHVCDWSAIDTLVTESAPPADVAAGMEHGQICIAG